MSRMYGGVNYQGYSDEEKPTQAKEGETYLVIDTAEVWTWHNNKWCLIGAPRT